MGLLRSLAAMLSAGASLAGLSSAAAAAAATAREVAVKNPVTYGLVLFRAFDPVDVMEVVDVLQYLGQMHRVELELIHVNMSAVTTRPQAGGMVPLGSETWPAVLPTHTLANASAAHDVLVVPGGLGIRSPDCDSTLEWIAGAARRAKTVVTVCTGSAFAARAGIMDGRRATTNKKSWPVQYGPNTTWVPDARWVVDDSRAPPIWSSSGVTAGLDMMLSFVEAHYSRENATSIMTIMEHVWIEDPTDDPFARTPDNGTTT
ncbi:DJ-1/PfpI family protein [Xylariaceae sp. FL0804]|nr:DJ-1/PfpI family protein [Xylariaceae sp. FL0804]